MKSARLTIEGRPVPKSRPRVVRGGHAFTPGRSARFEDLVAWEARRQRIRFGAAPLEVRIHLWSTRPLRGDVDNYAKAILDGLQKGDAFDDDRQVVRLDVRRVVGGDEKVVVHLRAVGEAA